MSNGIECSKLAESLHGLFDGPLLAKPEDQKAYARLYEQVAQRVQPKDIFDQMMVLDVTQHYWEQQRIRRCAEFIVKAARRRALADLLSPIMGNHLEKANRLAELYFDTTSNNAAADWMITPGLREDFTSKNPITIKDQVMALLAKYGLDESAIDVQALRMSMAELASCEDLIGKHEMRRQAILRAIERRHVAYCADKTAAHQANGTELPHREAPPLTVAPAELARIDRG